MRKRLFSLAALSFSLAACAGQSVSNPVVNDEALRTYNGMEVRLTEEGGIAAFLTVRTVRHDDRAFTYQRGYICHSPALCTAPLEVASGTLSPTASDSLFNIVLTQLAATTKDDYGITRNGADMISYTIVVSKGAASRTITADDGTMPEPMRQLVQAVHGTIDAARK